VVITREFRKSCTTSARWFLHPIKDIFVSLTKNSEILLDRIKHLFQGVSTTSKRNKTLAFRFVPCIPFRMRPSPLKQCHFFQLLSTLPKKQKPSFRKKLLLFQGEPNKPLRAAGQPSGKIIHFLSECIFNPQRWHRPFDAAPDRSFWMTLFSLRKTIAPFWEACHPVQSVKLSYERNQLYTRIPGQPSNVRFRLLTKTVETIARFWTIRKV
jgi:hypothetical protein